MRATAKARGLILLAATAVIAATVPAVLLAQAGAATTAGTTLTAATLTDAPTGFIYGTDSWPVSGTGSAPYKNPVIGGWYGGYIGMAGNWALSEGCKTGNFLAWSSANSAQANYNYTERGIGIGTGAYWYMGGPGVDPNYNGGTTEAYRWGVYQAALALQAMKKLAITYPVVWADIEMPDIAPALDNGWNTVYTSPCSGKAVTDYIPAILDRTELDGFAVYIAAHSNYHVGVYSAPSVWTSIFGTGTYSLIPNTYEWTYTPESSHLTAAPVGWCLRGTSSCAQFFGGQSTASKYALMWQWSGGGGVTNGVGDFDQIDVTRMK